MRASYGLALLGPVEGWLVSCGKDATESLAVLRNLTEVLSIGEQVATVVFFCL